MSTERIQHLTFIVERRRMMGGFQLPKKIKGWILDRVNMQNDARQIAFDESGFTVTEHGEILARVAWPEVLEIFAYKEDRITCDDICLGFRIRDDGTYYMVGEDFTGYEQFVAGLTRWFAGIRTDWFREVAVPAFASNRTTLWGTTWRSGE